MTIIEAIELKKEKKAVLSLIHGNLERAINDEKVLTHDVLVILIHEAQKLIESDF